MEDQHQRSAYTYLVICFCRRHVRVLSRIGVEVCRHVLLCLREMSYHSRRFFSSLLAAKAQPNAMCDCVKAAILADILLPSLADTLLSPEVCRPAARQWWGGGVKG